MSLFNRSSETRSANLGLLDLITQYRGSHSNSGPRIDSDSAMRLGTVWACTNILSELVGVTIDYHAHRLSNGVRQIEPTDPSILTNPSPTPNVSALSWRRSVMMSWLLRGNAWGLVTSRDSAGRATAIDIINPDYVTFYRQGMLGPVTYRVLGEEMKLYPEGDLWHKPAHVAPGFPVGLSPVEYGANAMGLGTAAEQFGQQWFGDGATPSAILSSDQIIDDETADGIKSRFIDAVRGRREPAVLGRGLSYSQISVAAEESQFLDTIKANRTTVAQFFGMQVALDLVGGESGSSMTYQNVEQQNLNVLLYAASPWIRRMEELFTELTPRPNFVVADLTALLRTDAKTRSEIESTSIRAGVRSANEVRHDNNLPPVDGGERVLFPPYAVAFDHSSSSGQADEGHPLAPAAPLTSAPNAPGPVPGPIPPGFSSKPGDTPTEIEPDESTPA